MGGPGPRLNDPSGADPPGPVRDVRLAVRSAVREHPGGTVVVGVSGGPDSLALLAAAVAVAGPLQLRVSAVCVDHGLHPRTAQVAARATRTALGLGAHRVQFGANPWLAAWFRAQVVELLEDMLADPASSLQRLVEGLGRLPDILRAPSPTSDAAAGSASVGLIDLVQTPEQKARLDALTAVMSLLEGHADVVMDAVGPSVVPTVAQIRARFGARRGGTGPLDRTIRRLLGLDAKIAQYRDGARFVRAVSDQVGTSGFNAVWSGPDTLPTPAELREPAAWVARVHA